MANKLKNLQLTSVDLVRSGANQEADICIRKSDDSGEAPELNIFKRFLNWLKDNPQEVPAAEPAAYEIPMDDKTFLTYADALAKSIQSIQEDDSLDEAGKADMIQKSFEQYNEAVEKINPYHDERGRFATAAGGIAHATVRDGGSTTNLRNGTSPKDGYSFVMKEDVHRGQQVAVNKYWSKDKKRAEIKKALGDFIEKNKDVLKEGGENGKHMGTWFDTKTGTLWLDVSTNFKSKSEAIKRANEAGEIAIWDAKAGKEIRLRDSHT